MKNNFKDLRGVNAFRMIGQYLLVVYPGRAQGLLKLGETHNVYVDELHHLIPLGWAAGFVSHHLSHDPVH